MAKELSIGRSVTYKGKDYKEKDKYGEEISMKKGEVLDVDNDIYAMDKLQRYQQHESSKGKSVKMQQGKGEHDRVMGDTPKKKRTLIKKTNTGKLVGMGAAKQKNAGEAAGRGATKR